MGQTVFASNETHPSCLFPLFFLPIPGKAALRLFLVHQEEPQVYKASGFVRHHLQRRKIVVRTTAKFPIMVQQQPSSVLECHSLHISALKSSQGGLSSFPHNSRNSFREDPRKRLLHCGCPALACPPHGGPPGYSSFRGLIETFPFRRASNIDFIVLWIFLYFIQLTDCIVGFFSCCAQCFQE